MNRRQRAMMLGLLGGGKPWEIEKTTFEQSLGDNLFTIGDMETGDPPTGFIGYQKCNISLETDERTGGTGSKSLGVTATDTGSVYSRGLTGSVLQANTWFEYGGWIKSPNSKLTDLNMICGEIGDSTSTFSKYYNSTSWGRVTGLIRGLAASGELRQYMYVAGVGDKALFDDLYIKKITPNAQLTLPSADAQIDVEFTLPGAASGNAHILVLFRVDGDAATTGTYLSAKLMRHVQNTSWGFEAGATKIPNIGTPDALRIKCIGDKIRYYTRESGVWTQRGAEITDSTNQTSKGVLLLTTSEITPLALRGSQPYPF